MDFKQGTIGDLIESERLMVLTAPQRYGAYDALALDASVFLVSAVKLIDRDHETFSRFQSQVTKHHLLAVFSIVRLHKIQAMMNLRQVLEAGACAAFAIANPDPSHFVNATPEGTLDIKKLTGVYKWLDEKFQKGSSQLKSMKEKINSSTAHANIVYTHNNFRDGGDAFSTPFFDIEDEYLVKADLLMTSAIAILLIDLFYGVNSDVRAIIWRDDFELQFTALVKREDALRCEMLSLDRFKKKQEKFGHLITN